MLVIRKEQMAALQKVMEKRFEDWLVSHLRTDYPEETADLDDNAIRERIRYGIARAEGYGIQDDRHIVGYVELMFEIGVDFEDMPDMLWARQILDDPDIIGTEKIPLIERLRSMEDPESKSDMVGEDL